MVLELIIIGGVVYYYVRKNKQEKTKKAAFAAGQPYYRRDGTAEYPPNYSTLKQPPMYDNKIQIPIEGESVPREREQFYTDAVPVDRSIVDEKKGAVVETREVMGEKY